MKNRRLDSIFLIMLFGVAFGMLLIVLLNEFSMKWHSFITVEVLVKTAFLRINYTMYLLYLLKKRLGFIGLLFIARKLDQTDLIFKMILFLCGIAIGNCICSVIFTYQVKAIWVLMGMLFPHFLFYIWAMIEFSKRVMRKKWDKIEWSKDNFRDKKMRKNRKKREKKNGYIWVTIIGLLTECYVNPIFLRFIVKNM